MPTHNTSDVLQGWTSAPDGRGSLDILWSCTATILLSTWSAICLNVPEPGDTSWIRIKRKIWITFISIMGPEYLLGFALGQWQSARASVAHIKQLRQDNKWTLKHAFFADMGGFVLRTSDDVRFFLDTKHVLWLLEHHVISTAEFETWFILESKTIDDRNKSDIFMRLIAVAQAIWFCVNIIARGVQGLAVTTLEVTTVGIVIDSILVYYFWKDKPAGIESVEVIEVKMTLNEIILLEEDEVARTRPYFRTPLDFVSREIWSFNLIYHYLMNILKVIRRNYWLKQMAKSIGRRGDNDILPITGRALIIELVAVMAFEGVNFIAWNFHFPTPLEKKLWRFSSCGFIVVSVIGLVAAQFLYDDRGIKSMQEKVQKRRKALEESNFSVRKARWNDRLIHQFRSLSMKIMNNSPDNDPNLDMSLVFVFGGVSCFAIYTVFRLYVLVEDVIALRALPADVYTTVNWWAFIPHFG